MEWWFWWGTKWDGGLGGGKVGWWFEGRWDGGLGGKMVKWVVDWMVDDLLEE